MESQHKKLKPSTMYGYAVALLGFTLLMSMNTYYMNFYMTDIVRIPMVSIASVLLIGRVGDMISVPLIGGFVEKTNLKWGRYRSWLLIGAPLYGLFFVLIFTNYNLSLPVKIAVFSVIYIIGHIFVNLVFGALFALMPLMTKTNHERSSLSAARFQLQSLSNIIFGYSAMPLLLFFTGGGAEVPGERGFFMTTLLFAVVMTITFLIAFKVTKPFDIYHAPQTSGQQASKKSTVSFKQMMAMLLKNKHIMALIISDTLRMLGFFGFAGLLTYYFIYVLNDLPMLAVFLGSIGFINFAVSMVFPMIAKKVDKRTIFILGYIIIIASHLATWAFVKNTTSFIALIVLQYVGMTLSNCAGPAMYADATDYSELHYGKEGKGFLMSMANMPPKIALIIAGSLTALMLSTIGYEAGIESTPAIVSGIKNLTHFIPIVSSVLAVIVTMMFNKLTMEKVQDIQAQIRAKN